VNYAHHLLRIGSRRCVYDKKRPSASSNEGHHDRIAAALLLLLLRMYCSHKHPANRRQRSAADLGLRDYVALRFVAVSAISSENRYVS